MPETKVVYEFMLIMVMTNVAIISEVILIYK